MKVFFCHASEDAELVDTVFRKVIDAYPDTKGWLDRYEIVGGNDLIEKIEAGIASAEKFLVFLSERSIDKRWVQCELRAALMKEISGVNPDFVVPVKLGQISRFLPFLSSRRYIDLAAKTEKEWLSELHQAMLGKAAGPEGDIQANLNVRVIPAHDSPQAAIVLFEARHWAEEIGFRVTTVEPIEQHMFNFPTLRGMHQVSISEKAEDYAYHIRIYSQRILPGNPFYVGLQFAEGVDPVPAVKDIEPWEGTDGEQSLRFIDYKSA